MFFPFCLKKINFFFIFLFFLSCSQEERSSSYTDTGCSEYVPEWSTKAIWYQIFVERFYNGDTTNDPDPETMFSSSNFIKTPQDWHITSWTKDWYKEDDWAKNTGNGFYSNLQLRRYGGDLQGVLDKMDYLQELGITAIYFNPLNDAPSLHKYDARNFRHIDVNFGPDPKGDMNIMKTEVPDNPDTWKWTAADRMFLKVIEAAHQRGIRVILDYSWNHTGVEFWAWKDIVKNQKNSKYKDWYDIRTFDDPETSENEFDYTGWLNISSLPALKKVNVSEKHRIGHPYEGDLQPDVKKLVFAVTKRWLAPNGDMSKGLDGYRLDVADHIPMGFWRDYRKFVKSINPEAYLVGEIWWEEWPENLMNPVPYVSGDVFDATMNYQVYRPARYFFAKTDYEIDAAQFVDSLVVQLDRLNTQTAKAMMNVAATHDTPRLLTSFANRGKYKYNAGPGADSAYITGRPDAETYKRVKLYLLHQFTMIGCPHIWNGDEMGMWGADDPDCRKPLWWDEYHFEPEDRNNIYGDGSMKDEVGFNTELFGYYKKLINLRKKYQCLALGDLEFIKASGKLLIYERNYNDDKILVLLNAGMAEEVFDFPENEKYEDIFNGEEIRDKQIRLGGLSGRVIKRE